MKNYVVYLVFIIILIVSCSKNEKNKVYLSYDITFITAKNYINEYPDILKRFSKYMDYMKYNKETVYLISKFTINNIELINSEIDFVHIANYSELEILENIL